MEEVALDSLLVLGLRLSHQRGDQPSCSLIQQSGLSHSEH